MGGLATVSMQLGEYGLPLYSGASGALAAPSGVFVLRSSFQMIQLKSVSRFRNVFLFSAAFQHAISERHPEEMGL